MTTSSVTTPWRQSRTMGLCDFSSDTTMRFVDLFCGAGGFSLGMVNAGWTLVAGLDSNEAAIKTFNKNFPGKGFVAEIPKDVPRFKDIDCVIGGPPCQAFSNANVNKSQVDGRRDLPVKFAKLAVSMSPKVIVMEEVARFMSFEGGVSFRSVKNIFSKKGYRVQHAIIDAKDFCVPQTRRRLFIVATRSDAPFPPPRTCETPVPSSVAIKWPMKRNPSDHEARRPVEGTALEKVLAREREGKAFNDRMGYFAKAYEVIDPAKPSMTIKASCSTAGNGAYTVKNKGRYYIISVMDAQRLMGFPDSFKFEGTMTQRRTQIGNSVCPPVGKAIGEWAYKALNRV